MSFTSAVKLIINAKNNEIALPSAIPSPNHFNKASKSLILIH